MAAADATPSGPATCGRSASEVVKRSADIGQIWPRESGVLARRRERRRRSAPQRTFDYYAGLADTFPFEEPATPAGAASSG